MFYLWRSTRLEDLSKMEKAMTHVHDLQAPSCCSHFSWLKINNVKEKECCQQLLRILHLIETGYEGSQLRQQFGKGNEMRFDFLPFLFILGSNQRFQKWENELSCSVPWGSEERSSLPHYQQEPVLFLSTLLMAHSDDISSSHDKSPARRFRISIYVHSSGSSLNVRFCLVRLDRIDIRVVTFTFINFKRNELDCARRRYWFDVQVDSSFSGSWMKRPRSLTKKSTASRSRQW